MDMTCHLPCKMPRMCVRENSSAKTVQRVCIRIVLDMHPDNLHMLELCEEISA